ncbi:MAG: hypothetical protein ABGZ19_09210 [Verrucomicrobiales bacterium]
MKSSTVKFVLKSSESATLSFELGSVAFNEKPFSSTASAIGS